MKFTFLIAVGAAMNGRALTQRQGCLLIPLGIRSSLYHEHRGQLPELFGYAEQRKIEAFLKP
jgi:hypothetical protein